MPNSSNIIDIAQAFDHFTQEDKEDWEVTSKEDFIQQLDLNGKVVLYPMYDYGPSEVGFSCGPQTTNEALSDSSSIDEFLQGLVQDSPYANVFSFGDSENEHGIMTDELPQGKTASDAYEFIKQKLLTYDNVVLGQYP